jgi:hypothetical protein
MIFANFARWTGLVPFAVCASLLVASPMRGQAPPAQQGEIKAIVRISKELIQDVASRQEITAAVPFTAKVLGFYCQGVAHGRAELTVDINASQGDATFVVDSRGTAHTCARGVRGPIVVLGPVCGPIASRTRVRFEGRKFSVVETIPWVRIHIDLDSIQTRHGGPVGRAAGRLARPVGECLLPRAEAQATPIGRAILKNFVDDLAEQIVEKLNQTTSVEKTMNRLFPETRDWVFQLSADSQFVQAAYGPPGSPVPVLPENPGQLKDVSLELWLQSTTKEAQALAQLTRVPLAKNLVRTYIETTLPELAALAENRSVDSVGPWLVISIGAPKAD